jgi:hypothetical protein
MIEQSPSWLDFIIITALIIASMIGIESLIQKSTLKSRNSVYSSKNNNFSNTETAYGSTLTTVDQLTEQLVELFFKLNETMKLTTNFYLSPQDILQLLGNRRIFPFDNSSSCETTYLGSICYIKIEITYTQGCKIFMGILNMSNAEKLNDNDRLVLEKITDIQKKIISPSMNSIQKERVVHDYLISTSKYDHENYLKNTIPPESYTPYGLLFNHVAVCQSYAETFMLFMILLNIECYMVTGKVKNEVLNSNNHAWNIVKINGKYFHVDVTFDNPIPYTIGMISHNYFNRSDDFMLKTHCWNFGQYPPCL